MRSRHLSLVIALVLVLLPDLAYSQANDPLRDGIEAFRDGRYEAAVRAFERATEDEPERAEAYFLLARVYAETPLNDRRKANRALDRALELEPNNVTFLVGRLQQLKEESWNFFMEKIREVKRIELARKILAIDSTNAFAHEELGAAYIRDFWRYRNAVMLPSLRFGGAAFQMQNAGVIPDDAAGLGGVTDFQLNPTPGTQGPTNETVASHIPSFDPEEVFLADRFDVDRLREMGVPVQELSTRAQRAYDSAIGHLSNALRTDPRRRSVYRHLMEIYSLKGEYEDARDMLEDMYAFYSESPMTWLYLGLAHYRTGNMDAASKSFETAFEYMDAEEKAAFESLDYLLAAEEQDVYEDDPVAYASRFWTSKDPRYLTPYNERKLEHYARLVYADLLYGSEDLDLRGWDTQRGRILVRYGLPQSDVVMIPGSTSQITRLGVSLSDHADYTSRSDLQEIGRSGSTVNQDIGFDMAREANAFNIWDYGEFRFVFEDPFRNGEYRMYSPSAKEIAQGVPPWLNDYSIKARETFAKVPERYEYEPPGRQIELPYLVNAFKGEREHADVYVHYGVPIAAEGVGQEMINVSANVGAFLISNNRDILVERRQTVYGLKGEQVQAYSDASLWVDTQEMDAPPGNHQVSIEFETASGSTVAVQRRDIEVPDFSSENLQVSDVLLAYRVEEAYVDEITGGNEIARRGVVIEPAPWSVFSRDQPIYLYFEVYNLAPSDANTTDYEMEARLAPKDDSKGITRFVKNIFGGTDGVSVSLPGSGSAADEGHYLILDASNQETGLYSLVLRVRDNVTGRTVERTKELFLE